MLQCTDNTNNYHNNYTYYDNQSYNSDYYSDNYYQQDYYQKDYYPQDNNTNNKQIDYYCDGDSGTTTYSVKSDNQSKKTSKSKTKSNNKSVKLSRTDSVNSITSKDIIMMEIDSGCKDIHENTYKFSHSFYNNVQIK